MLTSQRRLGAGAVRGEGSRGKYHELAELEGEPHVIRRDLVDSENRSPIEPKRAIAVIAHLTDLHVTDVQSPARFEFVNRDWEDPRFQNLLTMQRPQEALNMHAIDAMVQTLNGIDALELVAVTGDTIDNVQRNELDNVLALLNGGVVHPDSGEPGYEGVQLVDWPDDIFWKPDGPQDGDVFRRDLGFPAAPGLLDRAMQVFEATGLSKPWLGCHGNHEEVCQGMGIVTPALAKAMVGTRKPMDLPLGLDRDKAVETFIERPEFFLTGETMDVTPDRKRRPISRAEFIEAAHMPGPYYVHDTPEIRFITLDTVCAAGDALGSIDAPQLHWLERRLEEVHSSFRSRDGSTVRTRHQDRLVVMLSHHGLDTLSNPRADQLSDALLKLLLRFQNVVLWLNGHIHANRITPRLDPKGGHGFWEVTTSSLVDWPCQARLVELFDAGAGLLEIRCTMVDHRGTDLAALHRELAANVPFNGIDSWREGAPEDRNAILLLPSPF
ncbi:MAG TPA: hypothetical protein VK256_05730 [Candidatus Eisenbacteria bacterium]|nr:hypothetical protein [Candidatus Eisenbacteria bacterium]